MMMPNMNVVAVTDTMIPIMNAAVVTGMMILIMNAVGVMAKLAMDVAAVNTEVHRRHWPVREDAVLPLIVYSNSCTKLPYLDRRGKRTI